MSTVSVTIEDKYNPEYGFQALDLDQFPDLNEKVNQFANDEHITPSFLAHQLIEALFHRDFNDGPKWDVDSSSCTLIDASSDNFPVSFSCEKQATWDHKDIYAVAKSASKITFLSRTELKIEKYSFYVSG